MNTLTHLLNIGTLATWLSVAGFGTVAVLVPNQPAPSASHPEMLETQWLAADITLGAESSPTSQDPPSTSTPTPVPEEALPTPPDLPDLAAQEPLPEVPAEPPPAPNSNAQTPAPPQQIPRTDSNVRPTRRPTAGRHASAAATGKGSPGGGSGLSNNDRLAAGNMPPPVYPAEARRQGQTGTLVVEFTVDTTGRVISAYALTPSPWPLLNEEAVRTVRRWTFPPGAVMKLQRPIVFQLR